MPTSLKPRERWRMASKDRTDRHLDWCGHPQTHELLEAALAEYATTLEAASSVEATTAFYRLAGAREFIKTLLNLGEEPRPISKQQDQQLDSI